jgi:enoyl-CoA hydratase
MSDTEEVLTEVREKVLLITINRPDQRNAVNAAVAKGIGKALDELDGDDELLLGIITGAGKGFCAGMDLKAFVAGERPWYRTAASRGSPGAPPRSR